MSRYESDQQFYEPFHKAVCNLDVWYWPSGVRRPNGEGAVPAKVIRGWHRGLVDLCVLPDGTGVAIGKDGVMHISDDRVWDHMGNLSGNAKHRGVYEFTPWAWAFMKGEIKRALAEKEAAERAEREAAEKAKASK